MQRAAARFHRATARKAAPMKPYQLSLPLAYIPARIVPRPLVITVRFGR